MVKRKKVDIIIPIYNAYDDLQNCVNSILKWSDLSFDRLLLVNDKSTDERIAPYLQSLVADTGLQIVLLSNEENMGFSKSVNRGILYSDKDVILLNSDTVVTEGWMDKIFQRAYQDRGIATVTPLSNSATICSIPHFCEDNDIPGKLTVDEYAGLVERISLKRYPRIPVAVGFCMFIKREVINIVGLLDGDHFQKGYGEENDFCWRAEQFGYYHILCDDTLIYHKGTVSFVSDEKRRLIEEHSKILNQRYPKQVRNNQIFCARDVNWDIRENLGIYTAVANGKKNVLYALHSDFREDSSNHVGGTQFHVQDLVREMMNVYNVFVTARDGEYMRLTIYTHDERISMKFLIGSKPDFPVIFDWHIAKVYREIMKAFSIDLVHVHHTEGLTLDIFYEAAKLGIPLAATLHDYYYACPTVKLLNDQNQFCMGKDSEAMCSECLHKICGTAKTVYPLRKWREDNLEALNLCAVLFTPSMDAKRIFSHYFPSLADKIMIIEHGSTPFNATEKLTLKPYYTNRHKVHYEKLPDQKRGETSLSGWAYLEGAESSRSQLYVEVIDSQGKYRLLPSEKQHRLDVAKDDLRHVYCGFSVAIPFSLFAPGKLKFRTIICNGEDCTTDGRNTILVNESKNQKKKLNVAFVGGLSIAKGSQLAYQMIKNGPSSIRWFIFGGIGDKDLHFLEQDNLVKTGWYQKEDLPRLLDENNIDLVCILPIWPETYCYTLSEALLYGVPTLVTDIGAVGTRAKQLDCGWVLPETVRPEEVLEQIQKLAENPALLCEKKNKIRSMSFRSTEEMLEDYKSLYGDLFKPNRDDRQKFDATMIYEGYLIGKGDECGESSGIYSRLSHAENELRDIHSSIGYKALLAFRQMKLPFKPQLKSFLFFCYKLLKRVGGNHAD